MAGNILIFTPGSSTHNKVINCKNKAEVISETTNAGGIAGEAPGAYFYDCSNEGNIKSNNDAGGIIGNCPSGGNSIEFTNCYNLGKIEGKTSGGIIGGRSAGTTTFMNSYNAGEVVGSSYSGGCIGSWWSAGIAYIYNFYNTGKVTNALIGSIGPKQPQIENVYCLENNSEKVIGRYAYVDITDEQKQANENNFYSQGYMQSKEFVEELNNNKTTHSDISQEWNLWKENKNKFPTF